MGGGGEGSGRALAALLLLALPLVAVPPLAWIPLAALGGVLVVKRRLWSGLRRRYGAPFLLYGLGCYLVSTLPMLAGGVQAAWDIVVNTSRAVRSDLAVCARYLRSLLSRRSPGYLILFLTHRCNAHCGHCFDTPQRLAVTQEQELDSDRIRRLARRLGPVGHLSLTGGEPLLRDDLPEIVDTLYRDGGVRSFSLSTNGSLPARTERAVASALESAPSARFIVTLSFDGIGDDHDRLRGVPGLYDRARETARRLRRLRQWHPQLRVHACATLFDRNEASFDRLVRQLSGEGFDQVEINRLRGTPADPGSGPATADAYAEARRRVRDGERSVVPGLAWLFRRLDRMMYGIVADAESAWPIGPCVAGRKLAVIHADGTILPCEMLRDVRADLADEFDGFTLGNLGEVDDDLGRLLDGERATRVRRMIRETDCHCTFECGIFATMVYRPWRLVRLLRRGPGNDDHAAGAIRGANRAGRMHGT